MAEGGAGNMRTMSGAVIALVVVAVLVVGVAASGAEAGLRHRRSFDPNRTLEDRAANARAARCLAPWGTAYRTRDFVMLNWLNGSQLLDAGDYSGAVEALRLAYRSAVGDKELLALFQRAQEIEAIATNRKAHLQHGHEGPGSTLRPQDVER